MSTGRSAPPVAHVNWWSHTLALLVSCRSFRAPNIATAVESGDDLLCQEAASVNSTPGRRRRFRHRAGKDITNIVARQGIFLCRMRTLNEALSGKQYQASFSIQSR